MTRHSPFRIGTPVPARTARDENVPPIAECSLRMSTRNTQRTVCSPCNDSCSPCPAFEGARLDPTSPSIFQSSVKTCCVSKASRLRFSRPTYRASMEPAILAIHDFAPTVVGPTEPDRAATASAHDDTRSQDHPQLHQQAQNVLHPLTMYWLRQSILPRSTRGLHDRCRSGHSTKS